jgi:DNA-binding response OmpR family regulator
MFPAVKSRGRILIVDRSVLAGNLYRLLFSKLGATLLIRRKFDDARPAFLRREKIDLAIFNSNAFGKKFDEIFETLKSDGALGRAKKIFVLKEGDSEDGWREKLQGIEGALIVSRPFHPDEFAAAVEGMLGGAR